MHPNQSQTPQPTRPLHYLQHWGSHPKRSSFCWTAHARRCGQEAGVGLHGCRPPNKKTFCRKGSRPEQKKINKWASQHRKKKLLKNEEKTVGTKKQKLFGRKRIPHLDLIELHIISQTTRPVKKCTESRRSILPVLSCQDFNMPVLFGRHPVL